MIYTAPKPPLVFACGTDTVLASGFGEGNGGCGWGWVLRN